MQTPALGSSASPSAKRSKVTTIRTSHTKSGAGGQLAEDGDPPSAGVEAAVQTDRNELAEKLAHCQEELATERATSQSLEERRAHYQEELATERATSQSLEERLAHCQEELATERAKSRSLEERISLEVASEMPAAADDDEPEVEDRLAALERLAAETGEASIFLGLERECVNLGKTASSDSLAAFLNTDSDETLQDYFSESLSLSTD